MKEELLYYIVCIIVICMLGFGLLSHVSKVNCIKGAVNADGDDVSDSVIEFCLDTF